MKSRCGAGTLACRAETHLGAFPARPKGVGKSACATSPFDSIATRYDELWTSTAIGQAQRELVWRHLDPLFHKGERLLDVGCGTGADAAHFAARGLAVHAVDSSPAMIREAGQRGGFTTSVLPAENLADLAQSFDCALSNFGALNCVADLEPVAHGLACVVRPGGWVALCTIGRFCLWEMLRHPLRRLRGTAPSSLGVTVRYPTVRQLVEIFAPDFTLVRFAGIGLAVPPSYVRLPDTAVRTLARIDRALAHLPFARAMADHRLVFFQRK